MPIVEEALVSLIVGNVGVAALIVDRMEPHPLTQNSLYPAISYLIASDPHIHSHRNDLDLNGITGLANPLFQIDAWDTDYLGAKNLAEAVRLAIQGFRGTVAGVVINGILLENRRDSFEDAVSTDDQRVHRVMGEYRVWHNEPQS